MKIRTLILLLALALAAGLTPVQAQTDTPGAQVTDELKTLMQTITDAWCTLDTSKAAPYYETEGKHVFYDLAPLKYTGWKEYADGSQQMFAGLTSLKITLAKDIQAHRRGNVAWGTATWQAEVVPKEGKTENLEGRWTVIWEKRGDKWLVVHEHFSAPLPPAPEKK
ncbi:MAG: nuclear transport factor 2 family protein [Bryobacteraceae bacterium]|jgi:ketosteroid isomerase-like protein